MASQIRAPPNKTVLGPGIYSITSERAQSFLECSQKYVYNKRGSGKVLCFKQKTWNLGKKPATMMDEK